MGWDVGLFVKQDGDFSKHDIEKACDMRDADEVDCILTELGSEQAPQCAHERICRRCLYLKNQAYNCEFSYGETVIASKWISHSFGNPISSQPLCIWNMIWESRLTMKQVETYLDSVKNAPRPPPYDEAAQDARQETTRVLEWLYGMLKGHPSAFVEIHKSS